MKYIEILADLKRLKVFSVRDLALLDQSYDTSKTSWWVKKWYIIPIIRGYYTLSEYKNNESIRYIIANIIFAPSYISLETVLYKYSIIPEYPFSISSVSTKKTNTFSTDFWTYSYNTIKAEYFWWYEIQKKDGHKILIANLEKAIIDFFYLRPQYKDIADIEWLRWNIIELRKNLDKERLLKYGRMIASPTLNKKIENLLTYIENDRPHIY